MQVEVTTLTRRGAAVMRRAHTVTAASIRFGRGTDNEVQLADIRVELAAAVLQPRPGGLAIEQLGDAPLRVRGQTVNAAPIEIGDEILIGPYRVVLTPPPEGCDAALSVELVQPMGDALQRLIAENRIGLDQSGLHKRRASWVLFVVLALICLVLPIGYYWHGSAATIGEPTRAGKTATLINMSWNPGQLSNVHRFFAADCKTCHVGSFARVPDRACLACHSKVGSHFDPMHMALLGSSAHELEQTRCAACHQEHRGLDSMVIRRDGLCVDCHRSLAGTAPKAGIEDVSGFPGGHPQFRATVVADAAKSLFTRVELGGTPKPADHPNLVFSHAVHLVPKGYPVLGIKPMQCADCHIPDQTRQGFLPITYKGQCARCHQLNFDTRLPWKTVPHGDDKIVQSMVADFYAALALKGGVTDDATAPAVVRRAPGTPFPLGEPGAAQRHDAITWAAQKTKAALAIVFFDPDRGCSYCHVVKRGASTLTVEPVLMRARFLPNARFDHAKHTPVACETCHAARQSQTSADVLIPGIKTCVACHGSETAALKAQSTCTSCHGFHHDRFGPMRSIEAAEK
jgi:predicted CXXCH cytochrome family protein